VRSQVDNIGSLSMPGLSILVDSLSCQLHHIVLNFFSLHEDSIAAFITLLMTAIEIRKQQLYAIRDDGVSDAVGACAAITPLLKLLMYTSLCRYVDFDLRAGVDPLRSYIISVGT
jgi:hypothetical protein